MRLPILIRRLEPDEWRTFRDVRLRALRDSPDSFGSTYERERDHDEAKWRGWLTGDGWRADLTTFVAEPDMGKPPPDGSPSPIGIATLAAFQAEPGTAHLFSMWVDPAARGRGIGRELVAAVVADAASGGAHTLLLTVTEGNDAAVSLYTSCGFVGTDDPPEPVREGSQLSCVTMRLLLGPADEDELVRGQLAYYDDRADVYDDVYFRTGSHSVDPVFDANWAEETAKLEASIARVDATGDVLELACGTGLWTRFLAPRARSLVAVDASERMLARTRERVGDDRVRYVRADFYEWEPHERFDLIVAGFLISHIPPSRYPEFWGRLARWLRPGGQVWFTDDSAEPTRHYFGAPVLGAAPHAHRRHLGDRAYTIVKLFWRPEDLRDRLAELGWDAEITSTGEHFFHGTARPRRVAEASMTD